MNYMDFAVIAVIVISGLLAFSRGMIKELFSVAGWVAAALVTLYSFTEVRPLARQFIPQTWLADGAAAVGVFVITLIVASLLSGMVARRVHESGFSMLDRSVGLMFGLTRGAVLVCLAYLLLNWAFKPEEQPKWVQTARSLPMIAYGAELLTRLAPTDLMEGGGTAIDRASEKARKAIEAEKALRLLTRPLPAEGTAPRRDGYTGKERKAMRRAVEGSR